MAGSKLSNLPSINQNNIDDQDLLYIVDGTPGSSGLYSNKITVGDFKNYIGAGGGGSGLTIRIVLTDNAGTPVLPQGTNFNTLYDGLINGLKSIQLEYLGDIYILASYSQDKLDFTYTGEDYIKTIRINSNDTLSIRTTNIVASDITWVEIDPENP